MTKSASEDCAQEHRTVVVKSDKEISTSENQTEQKPVLIILAGSAGAGKTTFYESKLKTVFPTLLKASASPLEQTETNRERARLLKAGQPFVYQDATIDSQIIQEAHDSGFDRQSLLHCNGRSKLEHGTRSGSCEQRWRLRFLSS